MDADRFLSTGAVARKLGVSAATVQRWCRDGRLTAQPTIGGHYRISGASVDAYLRSLAQPTAA